MDKNLSLPATFETKHTLTTWSNETIEMRVIKKTDGKGKSNLSHLARFLHAWFTVIVDRQTKELLDKMGYEYIKSKDILDYEVDLIGSGFMKAYYGLPVCDDSDVIVESHAHITKNDISNAVIELRTGLDLGFVNSSKVITSSLYERIQYDPATNICTFSMHKDWVPMFASCLGDANERHAVEAALLGNFRLVYSEKLYTFINGKIQSSSFMRTGELRCAINTFKELFGIEKGSSGYETKRFLDRYLLKCIQEVLEKSDLRFEYELEKVGRSYKFIIFKNIHRKEEERFNQAKDTLALTNALQDGTNSSQEDSEKDDELFLYILNYGEQEKLTLSQTKSLYEMIKDFPTAREMLEKTDNIYTVAKTTPGLQHLSKFEFLVKILKDLSA